MSIFNRVSPGVTATALSLLLSCDLIAQGGVWTTKAPMPTARQGAAAALADGMLYVVGGSTGHLVQNSVPVVEAYDPKTNTWTTKAPMPTPRCCMAAGVINCLIYVAGGLEMGSALATLEVYDPKTNTWATKAPMPTPRYALASGVVGGMLYGVGGFFPSHINTNYNKVEAYDPKTDTWSTRAAMPTARGSMAAQEVDGKVYVAGGLRTLGSAGAEMFSTLEVYDPKTDTWTTKTAMPTAGTATVSGVLARKLYVVGIFPNYPAYSYDPTTDSWESAPPRADETDGRGWWVHR